MPKNKSKNQQYIKTDIDYERLADAIVKAHERIAKTEAKERESQEKAEHDEWFKAKPHKSLKSSKKKGII